MKRFQTYFGVPIPPFKEKKMGAGAIPIRFVVTGKIPSKKNNQQAVSVRSNAKDYLFRVAKTGKKVGINDALHAVGLVSSKIISNRPYEEFVDKQRDKIKAQKEFWEQRLSEKGFSFPLHAASMNLRMYFKDRYVTDTVNKQQTIQDLLVECGVIANDDYKTLNPITSASACYPDELIYNIAFITLTFKLPSIKN